MTTKVQQLRQMAQALADETPDFFIAKGAGLGNRSTNAFAKELNRRAIIAFGQDYCEQKICGDSNHAVDYYFEDEETIVEIALGVFRSKTEFEKDIFKALLAQENHPVKRLVLIGKVGSVAKCASPARLSIINWAKRQHHLQIDIYDIENNHRS